ncbi:hypothetical protein BH20ACT5_BH20ACT5_06030 [soil metagenome]
MLRCMRTTINLPDGLADEVKAYAAAAGRTFTSVVEESLRAVLAEAHTAAIPDPLPSFGDPAERFLVDLSDRDAVWAVLDAESR